MTISFVLLPGHPRTLRGNDWGPRWSLPAQHLPRAETNLLLVL